jgi:hypothetical protein
MHRRRGIITAVAVLCACGTEEAPEPQAFVERDSAGVRIVESYRPSWGESDGWRIGEEPLFVIRASDGSPENRLLDPTSIDVDSRGRIIVGDGNQAGWDAVLVYDSLGGFMFQAGPILAFDMSGDRTTVFDPEGRFARLTRLPTLRVPRPARGTYGYTAGVDAAYGDGWLLAYPFGHLNTEDGPGPAWYEHLLLRVSPDGESWDTLGTFEISQQWWSGSAQEQYWYAPVSVSAVTHDHLYFARGDEFEIRRYDPHGVLDLIARRAWEPRPVSEQDRQELREWYLSRVASSPEVNDEILERIRRDMESARFAENAPPLSAILVDDQDNLWVEEFRWFVPTERPPSLRPARWSVFDPTGVWLGDVETPPGFILRAFGSDRVLGFMIDDFDVKEIYAFPLERGAA